MASEHLGLSPEAEQVLAQVPPRPERQGLTVEENRQAMLTSARDLGAGPQLWSVREAQVTGRGPHPGQGLPSRAATTVGAGVRPRWRLGAGGLETHDALCRSLADLAGCAVVAVDYRQPPEHRFPAAVHDVVDAVRLLLNDDAGLGLDGLPVAIGGDSAGGNLSAVAAQQLRGHERLVHQLLLVPVVDTRPEQWPSYAEFAPGLPLTRGDMDWYFEQYLPADADLDDPELAPLRCADLAGLPPATVITAGSDVLRDEGEAYAVRLREAGVPVEVRRCEGMFHTFLLFGERLSDARETESYAAARLRAAFAQQR